MPIQKCNGYKYGKSGKCYKGADAKKKAIKQAQAIKASQFMKGKK